MKVPVNAVGIKKFGPDRQSADRIPIANTKIPWLYSSYYRGLNKLVFDLHPIELWNSQITDKKPKIDGKLDDACWQDTVPLLFTSDSTPTYIRHDKDNLYIGFRQRAAFDQEGDKIEWGKTVTQNDGDIWKGRAFEIYITNNIGYYDPRLAPKKDNKIMLHFGVSKSGAKFDSIWRHKKGKQRDKEEDRSWNEEWQAKVAMKGNIMTGELEIPLKLIEDAGINRDQLQMILGQHMGKFHGKNRSWVFRDMALDNRTHSPAEYTVKLYFSEPDDVKKGERVFDILLQDKIVAKDVDIFKESGGRNKALVKEFPKIKATKKLKLELKSKNNANTFKTVPLLNAIEITKNKE
jgi:hypothetical protein